MITEMYLKPMPESCPNINCRNAHGEGLFVIVNMNGVTLLLCAACAEKISAKGKTK